MEEFIIDGKSFSILSNEEIRWEIEQAAAEHREINFRGKNLKFLSLSERTIDYGINLQDCWISGSVFLANTTVNGNINLTNSVIDGTFFFGRGKAVGSLILDKTKITQNANMVGMNITGSLSFNDAKVNGFISLAKAVILGDVALQRTEVSDFTEDNLTIKGDIYLKSAQVNGYFDASEAKLSGILNLENALIRRNLIVKNLQAVDGLFLKNTIFNKGEADFSGVAEEKIII
jgi:hypothetical protein